MPTVFFTAQLRRHVPTSGIKCAAPTLQAALDAVCRDYPALRGYLFDDQGRMRRHVNVFIEGSRVSWRDSLDIPVADATEIHVMQALSGG